MADTQAGLLELNSAAVLTPAEGIEPASFCAIARTKKKHCTIVHISELHAWGLAKPNVAPAAALASQQLPCMHAWSRKRHDIYK